MTKSIDKMTLLVDLGFIVDSQKPILSYAVDVYDMHCAEMHKHPRAQLIYSSKGVMKVILNNSIWMVPSNQAIWIPPMVEHQVYFLKENHVRNLFLDASIIHGLPDMCFAFTISPFLKELILKITNNTNEYLLNSSKSRLFDVLLDELSVICPTNCSIPMTNEPRLVVVIEQIIKHPGDGRGIVDFAKIACVSPRTLMRLFVKELGMSFSDWRKKVRLLSAIELLSKNIPVAQVAINMGYNNSSAFIGMFTKEIGVSPTKYNITT